MNPNYADVWRRLPEATSTCGGVSGVERRRRWAKEAAAADARGDCGGGSGTRLLRQWLYTVTVRATTDVEVVL
jgi:hypothetical protein